MDYEQEISQLFLKLGVKLLADRTIDPEIRVRIEFGKLLKEKFGNTLGGLLEEGVGFHPPEGLNENSLMLGLTNIDDEIHEYFNRDNNVVDAYYLLKVRWACFYSALLGKSDKLIKYAKIGLKYHNRTDNSSWHRTTDQWNFMLAKTEEFTRALKALKKILGQNYV